MIGIRRRFKQLIVMIVFFLIVGGAGFLVYRVINPPLPPATPDPTAHLLPFKIVFTRLLNVENNDYDFVAKVFNPNPDYGSPEVVYELTFLGLDGTEVSRKSGSFYILPGQTKHIIDSPLRFQQPLGKVLMNVISVEWQRLNSLAAQGVPLVVKNVYHRREGRDQTATGIFSRVGGVVLNASDFDLSKVDILVLLLDRENIPVAVGKTEIRTFLIGTERGFEVKWFQSLTPEAVNVEAEANSNILENSNFLRRYQIQPERFQQFY